MQVKRSKTTVRFGKGGDLPIAGNWDGNGTWEIGVRRPGSAKFLLRMPDGSTQKVALGDANDLPVTGDWDGNGVTDLGVFDQATATFTLLQKDPMGTPFIDRGPVRHCRRRARHRRLGRQRHHRPRRLEPRHRDVQQARRRGPDQRGRPGQEGPVRPARRRLTVGARQLCRSKTRHVLVAVATGVPDSSVTTPSLNATREPPLTSVPVAVSVPLAAVTARR